MLYIDKELDKPSCFYKLGVIASTFSEITRYILENKSDLSADEATLLRVAIVEIQISLSKLRSLPEIKDFKEKA